MRALTIKTRRGKLDVGRMRVVWRRFARYTQPHRAALLGAMLAATGATAAQLAAPWPIKVVFDHVLMPQPDGSWLGSVVTRLAPTPVGVLLWSCGAILLIAALDGFFSYVRDVSLARTGQMVVAKVRKDLFGHLQRLPPAVFERRPTGDLLTRLTGDVQMLQQMLVGAMVTAGQGLVLVLAMTVAMFLLNPLLAALALTAVPLTL